MGLCDDLGSFQQIDPLVAQTHGLLASSLIQAFIELQVKEQQVEKIEKLQGDELLSALAYIVGNQAIHTLRLELAKLETELEGLLKSLGKQHPSVVEKMASISELQRQIDISAEGAKAGLRAEYLAAKSTHVALQTKLDEMAENRVEETTLKIQPYKLLKEELDRRRILRDQLEARCRSCTA